MVGAWWLRALPGLPESGAAEPVCLSGRSVAMTMLEERETATTEMRDFARVMKAALLMIVRYLERRYQV